MRREWIIYFALLLITAAVFWPLGRYDFINLDDPLYATQNPHVQQGLTLAGVAWAFQATVAAANWHPVTWLSLMLDCQLFGNSAGAHHLVNLLFHIANTLLLFHIWRRMTGEVWPSALVAALFAWHPLHVESVAWISERKDVLSTFFGLLTIWSYSRYVKRRSRIEGRETKAGSGSLVPEPRRGTPDYCMALLFLALGLMSKPMLVTWPFVLLLLDFWPLERMTRLRPATAWQASDKWRVTRLRIPVPQLSSLNHLLLEKLPFLALAIASSAITFLVQRLSGTMSSVSYLPISERAGNALVSCVCYLGKMIWPDHLAIFYPYHSWAVWQVAGAAALLALITLAAVWQALHRPFLIVGWLWFLGTLLPVIGLVQVGMQARADRYTYVPLIGIFVMIVWGWKELIGRRPYTKFITGVVVAMSLASCIVVTSRQLRYWRNSETIGRHALDVTTHNVMIHFLLGQALFEEGKINESVTQLNEALEVTPWFPLQMTLWFGKTHCELAMVLASQGRIQEAIDHYREALRSNPNLSLALNNLAWILATNGNPKIRNGGEAVQLAEQACALTHYQKTIYIGTLAAAYAEAGRYDDAIKTAEMAIASANAAGETNLLEKNRQLLELYRTRHPYRETIK